MDILKFIYNNFIIGLPLSNYEMYKTGEISKKTNEDKIKEIETTHLKSQHDQLITLFIERKPEILTNEEREILYKCKKNNNRITAILVGSMFGLFSFYIYNLLMKKVFYNKTLFFGNVFILGFLGYKNEKNRKIKNEQVLSKYHDIISIDDLKNLSFNQDQNKR